MTDFLTVEEFGRQLITTGDLDPIYTMLQRAKLPPDVLAKWCMSYWCFYHAGSASFMAGAKEDCLFWTWMWRAARNEPADAFQLTVANPPIRWPRSAERRHFRGAQAIRGITYLHDVYNSPYSLVHMLKQENTVKGVITFVKSTIPQFGPWIAFKMADMTINVLGHPLDTADCSLDIYQEPVEGGKLAYTQWYPDNVFVPKHNMEDVIARLKFEFRDLRSPHSDQPIGVMEVETVLCKWKSHLNGHYPVGKDTHEIKEGLQGWGTLAESLAQLL